MPALDWAGMLRAGMCGAGLRPADVWALTPAELLLLVGPEPSTRPLGRGGMDQLLTQFPDSDGVGDENG